MRKDHDCFSAFERVIRLSALIDRATPARRALRVHWTRDCYFRLIGPYLLPARYIEPKTQYAAQVHGYVLPGFRHRIELQPRCLARVC